MINLEDLLDLFINGGTEIIGIYDITSGETKYHGDVSGCPIEYLYYEVTSFGIDVDKDAELYLDINIEMESDE